MGSFFLQVYEQGCSSKNNFYKFQILGSIQMDVFLEPETYYNYLNYYGMENYTLTYLENTTCKALLLLKRWDLMLLANRWYIIIMLKLKHVPNFKQVWHLKMLMLKID